MKINIYNEQESISAEEIKVFDSNAVKLADLLAAADYVCRELSSEFPRAYINLTYVDKETIRELNRDNREIDSVTDVLSFPMLSMTNGELDHPLDKTDLEFDEDGNKVLNLGDIIICLEVASEHAEEYGHSMEREVAFLTAHSMLHLLGYDHIEKNDEKIMIRLQKEMMVGIGLAFEDEMTEMTDHKEDVINDNIAYPAGAVCKHCGYVSILGRPNVGKSTLINYITGMKVAIVSHKPQTTRNNIRSIYNTDDSQIIFVDTAGVHKPSSKLAKIMVNNAFSSAKNADAVLLIVDGRFTHPGDMERKMIELCASYKKKVILAINKSDEISKESLLPAIAEYSGLYDFVDIIPISASTGDNVDLLLERLSELLPEGPRLFDSEYMTDQTEKTISAELIREQLLHYTDQEIPHGTAVEIDSFDERYKTDAKDEYDREMVVIKASIICERKSHKGIIIGKDGQMLKRIGMASRKSIERLLGCKVYLDIFVKVREDWKNNDLFLKEYGYRSEDDEKTEDGI